jgi:hypothetical protein
VACLLKANRDRHCYGTALKMSIARQLFNSHHVSAATVGSDVFHVVSAEAMSLSQHLRAFIPSINVLYGLVLIQIICTYK